MSLNRRTLLKNVGLGMGAASLASMTNFDLNAAAKTNTGGPKRVIFFLQNQGFDPKTAIPAGMSHGSLKGKKLPVHLEPLQPYIDRLHIINGLHGKHTSPDHSAYFGALGGFRGGATLPPSDATIDSVISATLPKTILPHLCIGMDSLSSMIDRSTIATLSASDVNKPKFMHSDPVFLYQLLYGGIAKGDIKKKFDARNEMLESLRLVLVDQGKGLPLSEASRYEQFTGGFKDIKDLQKNLLSVSDRLRKYAPKVDERYTDPKVETDWHDVLLELGISALKSGITNTLTIGSGRGMVNTCSWTGLGVSMVGHQLGHIGQANTDIWVKIRQYNARMMVKIIKELESVPEGNGTMMDNTLIVYTSNNADKQHTAGGNWPFMLIGDLDGRIKTGQFSSGQGRPINALYASLLHAVTGKSVGRFNMSNTVANKYDKGSGLLKEVLV